MSDLMPYTPHQILKKYWGYEAFRPLQFEIISSVLEGRDTIGLLTTGGGKSICYQVPGIILPGICLVISPLVALIRDQVQQLRKRRIPAAPLYASMSAHDIAKVYEAASDGRIKFLMISPERLQSHDFLQRIKHWNISMVAVDEAHCISQWGYDFRPSYLKISDIRSFFFSDIPILALTATATPRVVEDISIRLKLKGESRYQSSYFKPNLSYQIVHKEQKQQALVDLLKQTKGSHIVYVNKRKTAEELQVLLKAKGIESSFYHAGLSFEKRNQLQDHWVNSPQMVLIATNAFGMGIDNPNVKLVIHYHFPSSIEAYFQEAGRAGRGGQRSHAIALITARDIESMIAYRESYPSIDEVRNLFMMLHHHFDTPYELGEGLSFDFDAKDFCIQYKLSNISTQIAFDLLQLFGLITIESAYHRPARLQILLQNEELQMWMRQMPDYVQFIKQLIRTFEGLMTLERNVDLEYFSRKNHYQISDVHAMLRVLQRHDIVKYTPSHNKPQITFHYPRVRADQIPIDYNLYKQRKEIFRHQVSQSIDYLKMKNGCRSQFLLDYLGEPDSQPCGICDLCISNAHKNNIKDDAIAIREYILMALDKRVFYPLEYLLKPLSKHPEALIRKVLDRMLELNEIEKGVGETFRRL